MGKQTVIDLARREARQWDRDTEQKHSFVLKRHQGYILEVDDVLFHFDSAVMLPEYETEPDQLDSSPPCRLTAFSVIRTCYLEARKHSTRKVLVTGHTDTTGSESYNLTLSRLRALSVLHVLLGNKAEWVELVLQKNQVEDYQQILKWVQRSRHWGCDPGAVDNDHGPMTRDAVYAFQVAYNHHFKASIGEDGVVGRETWGAIFDVYMDELAGLMETDVKGLDNYRSALHFLKADKKSVGCGKHFPVGERTKNRSGAGAEETDATEEYRSSLSRRVEILFFEPKHEPPLDCHPDVQTCVPEDCVINRIPAYSFRHIPVEPAPLLVWIDLQTVDDFGVCVPKVDLTLVPEYGPAARITTGDDGYWGGSIRANGRIRIFLGDGKTPVYFAGTQGSEEAESDHEPDPAVLDPRIASLAISDLLVPSAVTEEDKKKRQTAVQRFGRLHPESRRTIRGGNQGEREGEPLEKTSGRGPEAPERLYRRYYGNLVVDNLFIAAGWDDEGKTDYQALIKHLAEWLKTYHSSAIHKEYFYQFLINRNLVLIGSDGEKLLGQFQLSPSYEVASRFGAYTPFECFGMVFRDMHTETSDLIVVPAAEPQAAASSSPPEGEAQVDPATPASEQQGDILPLWMALVEKDQKPYRRLMLGELAGETQVLYYAPGFYSVDLARHGGTGLLENYSQGLSTDLRKQLHSRNRAVVRHSTVAFESYIAGYIQNVKKTKTDSELYRLGPPDSHFIFPEPVGIMPKEMDDIRHDQATTKDFEAWKAVTTHLCEIWNVHGDGDIWLRMELEVDSGKALGKIIDVKYKWNWETTAEGNLKKKKEELTVGAKGEKTIAGIKYVGGLSRSVNTETGQEEVKGNFGAGKYSFEMNFTTGEIKAGVGPAFLRVNEETKQIGFGAQFSTRDLFKLMRKSQIESGMAPGAAIKPEDLPSVKFGIGVQIQLLQEATVLSFLMGTRGFFERRPISELKAADWATLDYDEQRYLKELGWHLEIREKPELKNMTKYYPANSCMWDLKRVIPFEHYPQSARTKWADLSYTEKKASLNLLGALWASEVNWNRFWQSFAPKTAPAQTA